MVLFDQGLVCPCLLLPQLVDVVLAEVVSVEVVLEELALVEVVSVEVVSEELPSVEVVLEEVVSAAEELASVEVVLMEVELEVGQEEEHAKVSTIAEAGQPLLGCSLAHFAALFFGAVFH